jgi:hypothetical protein
MYCATGNLDAAWSPSTSTEAGLPT